MHAVVGRQLVFCGKLLFLRYHARCILIHKLDFLGVDASMGARVS